MLEQRFESNYASIWEKNFPSERIVNVKTFSWEHTRCVQGRVQRLFVKDTVNMVGKVKEARPCRLWSEVRILFKYMYIC